MSYLFFVYKNSVMLWFVKTLPRNSYGKMIKFFTGSWKNITEKIRYQKLKKIITGPWKTLPRKPYYKFSVNIGPDRQLKKSESSYDKILGNLIIKKQSTLFLKKHAKKFVILNKTGYICSLFH